MNFFKKIFGKEDKPIQSYADFWNWFQKNELDFFMAVKNGDDIEGKFFGRIAPKLNEIREGVFYLVGMKDEQTADLILTPDGVITNIVFIEELVNAAPKIDGWNFTALKPAIDVPNVGITMGDYGFNVDNIHFYSNENESCPDEIDITVVHDEMNENNKSTITNGTFIFLDNLLGELDFITKVDEIEIIAKEQAEKELVPIHKLQSFLLWREKEFLEKYEGIKYDTVKDAYTCYEAKLENGMTLFAVFNTDLLQWDKKASHPWIVNVQIPYEDNNNGMPSDSDFQLMDKIEEDIEEELKDFQGYLNVGRKIGNLKRNIYFACKDFRKPSKVLYSIQQQYKDQFEITYNIYKDKYWQTFNSYMPGY